MKPLNLSKPHVIFVIGIPGAGKSFFANNFAKSFKAPIVSLDTVITHLENNDHERNEETASQIANHLFDQLIKTGHTIVFDMPPLSQLERNKYAKKAKDNGYEPMFVWVQTEASIAQRRATKSKEKRPINEDRFVFLAEKFTPPTKRDNVIVISGMHTYSTQLRIVLKRLANPENSKNFTRPDIASPNDEQRQSITRRFLIR